MRTLRAPDFTSVITTGGLLPVDVLRRILALDKSLDGLNEESYHLPQGRRLREHISDSWSKAVVCWARFSKELAKFADNKNDTPTNAQTRELWLHPLLEILGYDGLVAAKSLQIDGKTWPISHSWQPPGNAPIPVHLMGFSLDVDKRSAGVVGAATRTPHSLMQQFLNVSPEHTWGILSNGLVMRLYRDNSRLTKQAFVEFDLESMMEGAVYADFALLWLLSHSSRLRGKTADEFWIEKWSRQAQQDGVRALDHLRDGVQHAIAALGTGFLSHPANERLLEAFKGGALTPQDYYRELLRLVYRLVFVFVTEDRVVASDEEGKPPASLLLDPDANPQARERYLLYYSTARLRRLSLRRRSGRHGDLFHWLKLVMQKLGEDTGCPGLALPSLGGFLWSEKACPNLTHAELSNEDLTSAIRSLAYMITDNAGLRAVDFRHLGAEELGSVYESLLELEPTVNLSERTFEVAAVKRNARKGTGSFYTHANVIQLMLETGLAPLIKEALKRPSPAEAILDLKVCDPACGSGHFLVATAHSLAHALASVRTGEGEPDPASYRSALREIIGRCLYGVDVNEMAVELCKVALWLESMEPGKPLTFLDHRLKSGNSLVGLTPYLAGTLAGAATSSRKRKPGGTGQLVFDFYARIEEWHEVEECVQKLNQLDDLSIVAVHEKEAHYQDCARSGDYKKRCRTADDICAQFGESTNGQPTNFVHWYLAFPDVFHLDKSAEGDPGWLGGFDLVIGNPPYLRDSRKRDLLPRFLKAAYKSAKSHYDVYVLFIELALRICKSGGIVSLVTSNSYLREKYGREIGRLLKDRWLQCVYELNFFAFNASVHTCVISAQNRAASPHQLCRMATLDDDAELESVYRAYRSRSLDEHPLVTAYELEKLRNQATLAPPSRHMPAEVHTLFSRVGEVIEVHEAFLVTLGMVFNESHSSGKKKKDYLSTVNTSPFVYPLLDGDHVCRWHTEGNLWLDYRPDEHREPRFAELFESPKILCRRIIGMKERAMAYVDTANFYFSDNVVGAVPYQYVRSAKARVARCSLRNVDLSKRFSLEYVIAVLNSSFYHAFMREVLGVGKHYYPRHLKSTPMRIVSEAEQQSVTDLVHQVQGLWKTGTPEKPAVAELERRISERLEEICAVSTQPRIA